jgi:hypothetical protein
MITVEAARDLEAKVWRLLTTDAIMPPREEVGEGGVVDTMIVLRTAVVSTTEDPIAVGGEAPIVVEDVGGMAGAATSPRQPFSPKDECHSYLYESVHIRVVPISHLYI